MSEPVSISKDSAPPELTAAQSKGLWGMSRPLLVEQSLQLSVPVLDIFFLSRISDSAAAAAGAMTPVMVFTGHRYANGHPSYLLTAAPAPSPGGRGRQHSSGPPALTMSRSGN